MKEIFNQFTANFNKPGTYLISANILLVFFLILLNNIGVLPIKNLGNFIFFTFLLLLFTLYRPSWSFLFFIGTIALENINVAPVEIGINVRPYQLFAALTIVAVSVRLLVKRLNFELPRWKWIDIAVIIFAVAGFISAFVNLLGAGNADLRSLQQSIVAASFTAIYFLVRIFIQNLDDLKKIIPFSLSSSVVVILYGLWQNWRFMHGLSSFETMPGRPNATFAEADWLAIFLAFLLVVLSLLMTYNLLPLPALRATLSRWERGRGEGKFLISKELLLIASCWLLVVGCLALLILTVSRSAWLGAVVVTGAFLSLLLTNLSIKYKEWQWRNFSNVLLFIAVAIISSTLIVYIFNLTNFQLFNRIQSTGTGLQKITISCAENTDLHSLRLPEKINNISELEKYNCRHINLEEIETEKAKGKYVTEIYRTDPNVNIRSLVYQKSWAEIKKHPVLGIGWGNIGDILGKDERGASLNSSNIFLEVWLGAGILGLLAFILVWIYILIRSLKLFFKDDLGEKSLGLFLFLGVVALIVPNLFNAGIFLGIIWSFFGIGVINHSKN